MRSKGKTAIIVEGTAREPQLLNNMLKVLFRRELCEIILLPAGQNIYMLWKQLNADEFQTDIIEVLRESSKDLEQRLESFSRDDFAEVYLFFDYDGHQDNLTDETDGSTVLQQMLETFDDETENGKLYVSYPMVEALRDYVPQSCRVLTDCCCQIDDLTSYKHRSGHNNIHSDVRKYDYTDWCEILEVYAMRVSCLFQWDGVFSFAQYREWVSPRSVYEQQLIHIQNGQIFVLSAFPAFILEYYKESFWNSHVKRASYEAEGCMIVCQ